MRLHIKSEAVHAHRVLDSCLAINGVRPGNNVEQFPVIGHLDALGRGENAPQVFGAHYPVITGNGHHSPVIQRSDVPPGDTDIGRVDFIVTGLFRFFHRFTN